MPGEGARIPIVDAESIPHPNPAGGRPQLLNEAVLASIVADVRRGVRYRVAATRCVVSERSATRWRSDGARLANEISDGKLRFEDLGEGDQLRVRLAVEAAKARGDHIADLVDAVDTAVRSPDAPLAVKLEWLARIAPDEYGRRPARVSPDDEADPPSFTLQVGLAPPTSEQESPCERECGDE